MKTGREFLPQVEAMLAAIRTGGAEGIAKLGDVAKRAGSESDAFANDEMLTLGLLLVLVEAWKIGAPVEVPKALIRFALEGVRADERRRLGLGTKGKDVASRIEGLDK